LAIQNTLSAFEHFDTAVKQTALNKPTVPMCSAKTEMFSVTAYRFSRNRGRPHIGANENENENRLFGMAAMHAGFT